MSETTTTTAPAETAPIPAEQARENLAARLSAFENGEPAPVLETPKAAAETGESDETEPAEDVELAPLPPAQDAEYLALIKLAYTPDEARELAESGLATRLLKRLGATPAAQESEPDDDANPEDAGATGDAEDPRDARIAKLEKQLDALSEKVGRAPDATDELLRSKNAALFADAGNRAKAKEAMNVLREGYKATGKRAPSDAVLAETAMQMEFSEELRKPSRERLLKRQENLTARPSQRTDRDDVPGPAKAKRNLSENLRTLRTGG